MVASAILLFIPTVQTDIVGVGLFGMIIFFQIIRMKKPLRQLLYEDSQQRLSERIGIIKDVLF